MATTAAELAANPPFQYTPASIALATGSAVAYLVLLKVILPATKPQTKEAIATFAKARRVHNAIMFAFSTFCCVFTTLHLYNKGAFDSFETWMCSPTDTTVYTLHWVFVFSKIYEWIDTAFVVWLGRRPPMFLHVYHHMTTFWLFLLVTNFPIGQKTGLMFNGAVHSAMYAHYFLLSAKAQLPRWYKRLVPLITIGQILQLGVVTSLWHITPRTCAAFASFPSDFPALFVSPYLFSPVYLLFFIIYFAQRWFVPKKAKAKSV